MKITNLRQDSVNSMTLEIEGEKYRITGPDEITLRDAQKGIAGCFTGESTVAGVQANLAHYGRQLTPA